MNIKLYKDLLESYNTVHNITRLKDIDKEIEDSVRVLKLYPEFFMNVKSVADIGSGAGFPALFLASCMQDTRFYLYERAGKKAAFLRLVKTEMNMDNLEIKHQNFSPKLLQGKCFDLICSRAMACVEVLLNLAQDFAPKFLFYKGQNLKQELECLNTDLFKLLVIERKQGHYLFLEKEEDA